MRIRIVYLQMKRDKLGSYGTLRAFGTGECGEPWNVSIGIGGDRANTSISCIDIW
jgi:hypothetical protein